MIQDAMRKHRRIFLAVLLVLLIGPFVLWGGYSGMSSAPIERQVEAVATVGDRPVPAELFRSYLMSQRQQRSQFGQAPTPESMLQDGTAMQILEQLVSRVMLEEAAEKGEYIFDQDYLIEKLKDRPEFKDE
ncbi:MAG TPA: SurA N-terminal domain-containing protein, partial [Candidatus Hydrogenedentes bacterium]|nr:SurA N-terminal domain-containing protein [Candidatus Hydrogenedentota bacterium]